MDGAAFFGQIIGVLSLIAAVVFYLSARRPKLLGYAFEQWIPLLSETYPGLEVGFKGTEVARPYVFTVRLKNYGKTEIRREDFDADSPLQVKFIDSLIDAAVSDGGRRVRVEIQKAKHAVTVRPALINPGEEIFLTGLADVEDLSCYADAKEAVGDRLEVVGRIAGVAKITRLDSIGEWSRMDRLAVKAPVLLLAFAILVVDTKFIGHPLFFFGVFGLGLLLYVSAYVPDALRWRNRRRLR